MRFIKLTVFFCGTLMLCQAHPQLVRPTSQAQSLNEAVENSLTLAGLAITPHIQSSIMRYRRPRDPDLGARVELFLRNSQSRSIELDHKTRVTLDNQTPQALLKNGLWAWHDTPASRKNARVNLPLGAMTVWAFNSRKNDWGIDTVHQMQVENNSIPLNLSKPHIWLSSVTILGPEHEIEPDKMIVHIANESAQMIKVRQCRLWLPADNKSFLTLLPSDWRTSLNWFGTNGEIGSRERGGFQVSLGPLPLTYTVVEVEFGDPTGQSIITLGSS